MESVSLLFKLCLQWRYVCVYVLIVPFTVGQKITNSSDCSGKTHKTLWQRQKQCSENRFVSS